MNRLYYRETGITLAYSNDTLLENVLDDRNLDDEDWTQIL